MAGTDFSDEQLMRFVDGEVGRHMAEHIETAMRSDPDLAARIDMFTQTRSLARNAMSPLLDEPVPTSVVASVEGMIERHRQEHNDRRSEVIPLMLRPRAPAFGQHWAVPLAASMAAVLAGLGGFWLGTQHHSQPQMLSLGAISAPAMAEALTTVPAGGEKEIPEIGQLRVVSSFHAGNGDLCRELELTSSRESALAFVACRMENVWNTTFAVAIPADDGGYAPASSTDALDAYLSSIEASPALEASEERKALDTPK